MFYGFIQTICDFKNQKLLEWMVISKNRILNFVIYKLYINEKSIQF